MLLDQPSHYSFNLDTDQIWPSLFLISVSFDEMSVRYIFRRMKNLPILSSDERVFRRTKDIIDKMMGN